MTPWTAACQASLFTISWYLLKLMSLASVMASNHFILCHPLLLLTSVFLSIRIFSNEMDLLIRWPKYQSFNFSISPYNEYSGLISFRIDSLVSLLSKILSRVSSPTLQFRSTNSLVLSLLYGPTRTSIQDYGKNPSFGRPLSAKKWYLCF